MIEGLEGVMRYIYIYILRVIMVLENRVMWVWGQVRSTPSSVTGEFVNKET